MPAHQDVQKANHFVSIRHILFLVLASSYFGATAEVTYSKDVSSPYFNQCHENLLLLKHADDYEERRQNKKLLHSFASVLLRYEIDAFKLLLRYEELTRQTTAYLAFSDLNLSGDTSIKTNYVHALLGWRKDLGFLSKLLNKMPTYVDLFVFPITKILKQIQNDGISIEEAAVEHLNVAEEFIKIATQTFPDEFRFSLRADRIAVDFLEGGLVQPRHLLEPVEYKEPLKWINRASQISNIKIGPGQYKDVYSAFSTVSIKLLTLPEEVQLPILSTQGFDPFLRRVGISCGHLGGYVRNRYHNLLLVSDLLIELPSQDVDRNILREIKSEIGSYYNLSTVEFTIADFVPFQKLDGEHSVMFIKIKDLTLYGENEPHKHWSFGPKALARKKSRFAK